MLTPVKPLEFLPQIQSPHVPAASTIPRMPDAVRTLGPHVLNRYRRVVQGIHILDAPVCTLSDYLAVMRGLDSVGSQFWYRGHGSIDWTLTPRALRFHQQAARERAIALLQDFKRYAPRRVNDPTPSNDLEWTQVAQHYGLPTRLLDWTRNPSIALYFACLRPAQDGVVYILDPLSLNDTSLEDFRRIPDSADDLGLIKPYLRLDGKRNPRGVRTIGIDASWTTERMQKQDGAFTLHGSHTFRLTASQAPVLMGLPILRRFKQALSEELEQTKVTRSELFPELEHLCAHLMMRARLPK